MAFPTYIIGDLDFHPDTTVAAGPYPDARSALADLSAEAAYSEDNRVRMFTGLTLDHYPVTMKKPIIRILHCTDGESRWFITGEIAE
jgi:hypothetical protein